MTDPRILAQCDCKIRKRSDGREFIDNGPVYDLASAQALVKRHGVAVFNQSAADDMRREFSPSLTEDELEPIILALDRARHSAGSERCATSFGTVLDCDAYVISWNQTLGKECPRSGKQLYIKFGFKYPPSKCLVIRIHPAKYR